MRCKMRNESFLHAKRQELSGEPGLAHVDLHWTYLLADRPVGAVESGLQHEPLAWSIFAVIAAFLSESVKKFKKDGDDLLASENRDPRYMQSPTQEQFCALQPIGLL
jgi:hypothetical protein